jgi:hypothetical protein
MGGGWPWLERPAADWRRRARRLTIGLERESERTERQGESLANLLLIQVFNTYNKILTTNLLT